MTVRLSLKAESFGESVIREMTRVNLALHGPERAINFAQGFPDFEPSTESARVATTLIEQARALCRTVNRYRIALVADPEPDEPLPF